MSIYPVRTVSAPPFFSPSASMRSLARPEFNGSMISNNKQLQTTLDPTVDGRNPKQPVEVVYPIIYRVLAPSQVVVWDFFYQLYGWNLAPELTLQVTSEASTERERKSGTIQTKNANCGREWYTNEQLEPCLCYLLSTSSLLQQLGCIPRESLENSCLEALHPTNDEILICPAYHFEREVRNCFKKHPLWNQPIPVSTSRNFFFPNLLGGDNNLSFREGPITPQRIVPPKQGSTWQRHWSNAQARGMKLDIWKVRTMSDDKPWILFHGQIPVILQVQTYMFRPCKCSWLKWKYGCVMCTYNAYLGVSMCLLVCFH